MPLLEAGADGAIAESLRQAQGGGASATRRVLQAVRDALGGKGVDRESVAAALRSQLEDGALSRSDLVDSLKLLQAGRDANDVKVEGNAYIQSSIAVNGDFHG